MQQQTPIQQDAGLKIEPQSVGMELSQGLSMGRPVYADEISIALLLSR